MNNAIWEALCRALQESLAGGAPLTTTPEHLRRSGPCPVCQHRIDPSAFSSVSPGPKGAEVAGLIVCGGCATPLMYRQSGKFELVPKKIMKRLPKSTLRFVEKSQELVRVAQRKVN